MILINSFLVKKSIISSSGFHPISSFIHTIILPKASYPMSAFALSNYMFVQFWYRDEKEHSVKVTINNQKRDNEQEAAAYTLPPQEEDERVYQETFILPRIVVSEPQTIWISTYSDGNKVQDYPIEFLYR
ncbi:MAG: hypothetical protein Q8R48_00105 [Candidatus Omnitrophota bacterium]|nr:hypothetical protein [Candidatus Omnitrophota bacterium]